MPGGGLKSLLSKINIVSVFSQTIVVWKMIMG